MPAETQSRAAWLTQKWLTIVGIGEDGVAGLGDEAKRLIADAEFVFGGTRHLALVASLTKGEAHPWPAPFDPEMRDVLALSGRRVCVLASGDPFFHGVGVTLARKIPSQEMQVIPAPSAMSLAAARLGWALQDIETISLHGRSLDLIRPLLHPGTRILALTSDGDAPAAIARLLIELDFGASRLTILEALGGPNEKLRSTRADAFDLIKINPLNVLAIEVDSTSEARILPLTSGLADHLFEHDGQITKREIRAITLSALAPRRGELLWDIGAGSGSIGIEWMLAHPTMRAIAIEADPTRAARIQRNASHCGVPGLVVVEGSAPKALAKLGTPDAIFIGGGGSDTGVLGAAIKALRV
ncbi:precorrin-6y C5,15-methyltransferase (decarboxylating) subunit CbiE, partial [Mesorhizobium mediterraneum]|uniref:precorrin-6y C5,15-methyltransferase (decarboxylating) subunit CbiE n=1 Tax=Mesorhizobium mediterraneum TaxID=43617 RepID=UPI00177CC448